MAMKRSSARGFQRTLGSLRRSEHTKPGDSSGRIVPLCLIDFRRGATTGNAHAIASDAKEKQLEEPKHEVVGKRDSNRVTATDLHHVPQRAKLWAIHLDSAFWMFGIAAREQDRGVPVLRQVRRQEDG